jgi:hypothetical protein
LASFITQSPELVFLIQICSIILPIRVVAFSHPFHPARLSLPYLGSGLIDQSQKMTVAARAMAEKKAVGHRS